MKKQCVDVFSCAAVLTASAYAYASVYSPVALAMISFDTFAGTSEYESNTME
jgi:hypothetical protein